MSDHRLTNDQRRTAVEAQLSRMMSDQIFARAGKMVRLLRYIVDAAIDDRGDQLNQYVLAQDVFERAEEFDPAVDAIVRVEVGRFRTKLREYYSGPGANDPITILLPKRSYAPVFEFRNTDDDASSDAPVIAVLAFDNMSDGAGQDFFADGLAEDLIADLSRVAGLTVIARQSSFAYKGASIDIRLAGDELGADYIVEGSVRRAGSKVRVNEQLISVATGGHIWAERYDRKLTDVFADLPPESSLALK